MRPGGRSARTAARELKRLKWTLANGAGYSSVVPEELSVLTAAELAFVSMYVPLMKVR